MTDQPFLPIEAPRVRDFMQQIYQETDRRYPGLSPERRRRRALILLRLYRLRHGMPPTKRPTTT